MTTNTRTTRSQTRALVNPSPRFNPLSTFGSSHRGPIIVDQFRSFSARRTPTSASQARQPPQSPTPGAHIVELPGDSEDDASSHTTRPSSRVQERRPRTPPNNGNPPNNPPNDPPDDPGSSGDDSDDDLYGPLFPNAHPDSDEDNEQVP